MKAELGMGRAFAALVLAATLTACSSEPYYLGNLAGSSPGQYAAVYSVPKIDPVTKQPYFSVCYNKMLHTAQQVRTLVEKNCADPYLYQNRVDLYSCSAEAPVRATYSCTALSREASEARPNLLPGGSFLGTLSLY